MRPWLFAFALGQVASGGLGCGASERPQARRKDGWRDAAVIVAPQAPDGPTARAWAEYLVRERGLARRRVHLLDGWAASDWRVVAALRRAERQVGSGAMVWMVYLGRGQTNPSSATGVLELAVRHGRATTLDQREIAGELAFGPHHSALFLADACHEAPRPGHAAGLPAPTLQWKKRQCEAGKCAVGPAPQGARAGTAADFAELFLDRARWLAEAERDGATPAEVTIISAMGSDCGRRDRSLATSVLQALRGAGDADGDGKVTVREVAARAASTTDSVAKIEVSGADLILASVAPATDRPVYTVPPATEDAPTSTSTSTSRLSLRLDDRAHVLAGEFDMGCVRGDKRCEADESPVHSVAMPQFTIDRREVTWDRYAQCVDAGGCSTIQNDQCYVWRGKEFVLGAKLPDDAVASGHPVVCATWFQAVGYCRWAGLDLPSEAQWERAARGDARTVYPWGNERPTCTRANLHGCDGAPQRTGARRRGASPAGVFDMAGNVAEWVFDWYESEEYATRHRSRAPRGPDNGEVRIVRGGSFYDGPDSLRTSYRYGLSPEFGYSTVGFRCRR